MNYSEKKIYCDECGRDITNKHQFEDRHHNNLCEDCLLMLHEKRDNEKEVI